MSCFFSCAMLGENVSNNLAIWLPTQHNIGLDENSTYCWRNTPIVIERKYHLQKMSIPLGINTVSTYVQCCSYGKILSYANSVQSAHLRSQWHLRFQVDHRCCQLTHIIAPIDGWEFTHSFHTNFCVRLSLSFLRWNSVKYLSPLSIIRSIASKIILLTGPKKVRESISRDVMQRCITIATLPRKPP